MAVQVYGANHVVIEVDDVEKAVAFYTDVFNLKMLRGGEGAAWCKLGEHQFLAIFEVSTLQPDRMKHFGLIVRDEDQIREIREKVTKHYGLQVEPDFRCDFRDPWGNRIQVVDLMAQERASDQVFDALLADTGPAGAPAPPAGQKEER